MEQKIYILLTNTQLYQRPV